MTEQNAEAVLNRALTIGGIGRSDTGDLSPVTKAIYAGQYARACAWKLAVLAESSRTFTPEQVAQYAQWLVEQGYARATADLAVRAIRWGHRVAGSVVPDRLPATYVLRGQDPTAAAGYDVNDCDAPARRDPTELLSALVAECKPGTTKGKRDLCLLNLIYATGLSSEALVALDCRDVLGVNVDSEGLWSFVIRRGETEYPIRHLPEPGHYATLCPACCVHQWRGQLVDQGADDPNGPFFRSVDKSGNVASTFGTKGGRSTRDGRLAVKSVGGKILRDYAEAAGLLTVLIAPSRAVNPGRALRLAGAAAAYARGEITLVETARRAAYHPESPQLLQHLLELTAPPAREETA